MSKKEIKLHIGFMDENGNLVEIPENIQKHIEAREEFWANKIKAIDSKCGIVLERLELTEKALELAYEEHKKDSTPANWVYHINKEEYMQYLETKAREMMKR